MTATLSGCVTAWSARLGMAASVSATLTRTSACQRAPELGHELGDRCCVPQRVAVVADDLYVEIDVTDEHRDRPRPVGVSRVADPGEICARFRRDLLEVPAGGPVGHPFSSA